MKKLLILSLSTLLLCSCSRKVAVYFEPETADITPSDEHFYHHEKTVCIKSANQNVVYSANELSSQVNILINQVEKVFQKSEFDITKEGDNPDLLVEIIGIETSPYETNKVVKRSGKRRTYHSCKFTYFGHRAFVKVTNRNKKTINYTFYQTPCVNGCQFRIGTHCDQNPIRGKQRKNTDPYELNAKANPLNVERLGRIIAKQIIEQINNRQ